MRVGIVGPIWLPIPPKGYGGTEEVVYNLVTGLIDNGHDVTLFGPKTSQIPGKLISTVDTPLHEQNVSWDNIGYTLLHLTEAFSRASEFDILHVHLNKAQDYMSLPLSFSSAVPVLFTLHFLLPSLTWYPDRYALLNRYSALPYTSISNSQQKPIALNYIASVYNALAIESFSYSPEADDYFVWLGKVKQTKGTKEAILAAKKANAKLFLMGTVDTDNHEMFTYYEQEVKPLIDNKQIIWIGEVNLEQKSTIMRRAKAFLNPIQWEEPFGLVMVESQAVGTPVISFNRGAASELIIDGKTGFLVETLDEMVEKMQQVDSLDRGASRQNVEDHFTIPQMTKGYENAYQTTLSHWQEYRAKQEKLLEHFQA